MKKPAWLGVVIRANTNQVGLLALPFPHPGRYTINAATPGFKRSKKAGIVVDASKVTQWNLVLEPGAVNEGEMVTVSAEAPLLDSSQSTVRQFIDSRTVSDMPLAGRRALDIDSRSFFRHCDSIGNLPAYRALIPG